MNCKICTFLFLRFSSASNSSVRVLNVSNISSVFLTLFFYRKWPVIGSGYTARWWFVHGFVTWLFNTVNIHHSLILSFLDRIHLYILSHVWPVCSKKLVKKDNVINALNNFCFKLTVSWIYEKYTVTHLSVFKTRSVDAYFETKACGCIATHFGS